MRWGLPALINTYTLNGNVAKEVMHDVRNVCLYKDGKGKNARKER